MESGSGSERAQNIESLRALKADVVTPAELVIRLTLVVVLIAQLQPQFYLNRLAGQISWTSCYRQKPKQRHPRIQQAREERRSPAIS